ncbi:CRISPR-associated endonuclease Cas2 [Candidatus Uhrbacteria bacterium]|nr:CRISPR-associated endonuclease Cas2 [Candidatus Uhrbacteria bacterium]
MEFAEHQDKKRRQLLKEQRQYLHYLKRQELIEMKKIGERLEVRLTEKGWAEALRNNIKSTTKRCKNGVCYFVIFDVPEKERRVRNTLRDFLKECGFKKIQHSVWMTDREVLKSLQALLQRRKLEQWIRIVSGNIVASSVIDRLKLMHRHD